MSEETTQGVTETPPPQEVPQVEPAPVAEPDDTSSKL